ncbi:MAG: WhiB family transcriptional regulator [Candidatus Saccharimonadales bacterium]
MEKIHNADMPLIIDMDAPMGDPVNQVSNQSFGEIRVNWQPPSTAEKVPQPILEKTYGGLTLDGLNARAEELVALGEDVDWRVKALCGEMDPDIFFPEERNKLTFSVPKRICASCPVKPECAEAVIAEELHEEPSLVAGYRAGMSERERRKMYVKMLAAKVESSNTEVTESETQESEDK